MRTINFSDARGNLKAVLDTVASDHTIALIKRRDAEDAVVMSLSDYNALQETLYLFGSRANAERLHAAMDEADRVLPQGARILEPQAPIYDSGVIRTKPASRVSKTRKGPTKAAAKPRRSRG
ncbi:type II toxin-antitoxin system prevent-host-death family antitoxin [Dyella sp.]|uniref:type II toxin-antitoxin system Phd/YefM family antitoxin n=1 Tax=Dyella sp. TaxID=1869338 RepID=UPI002B489CF3|nr:type II toxin-antitoxin system prevent-host-death family antitoxin [Dyella sp.]HKT27720.1 type II toxin-antitoxin system prevent-host-death family antitoxin [Dyella sp.]